VGLHSHEVVRSSFPSSPHAATASPASALAAEEEVNAAQASPPVRLRAPRVRFAAANSVRVPAPRRHRKPPFGVAVPPEAPLPPLAERAAWLAEVSDRNVFKL
jgi:hypothetical protein